MQPNAVRELADLGLAESVADAGTELTELSYHNHLGQRIWHEPRGRASDCDWPQLALHRGVLQSILVDAVRDRLGPDALTTDARVTGFTPLDGGGTEVLLAHRSADRPDSRIRADVLIGADGLPLPRCAGPWTPRRASPLPRTADGVARGEPEHPLPRGPVDGRDG
ncbi:hypothetical protein STENM36S_03521 [Streptomyces tendae]